MYSVYSIVVSVALSLDYMYTYTIEGNRVIDKYMYTLSMSGCEIYGVGEYSSPVISKSAFVIYFLGEIFN